MSAKKIIRNIHLWLGFSSGIVVFIIAVTGCIYAFQVEIKNLVEPYRFIEAKQQEFLLPSVLRQIAEEQLPGRHAHSVLYGESTDAAKVIFFENDPLFYYAVYINPYNGEVLKVKDLDADFFRIILMGHYYLWLPSKIGQPIAASATLVFVVMMISGLYLWWPRKKKNRKQRYTIKWSAKWRRRNYDLHNVLGFYMTWVAIFLAITGLVWGFEWVRDGIYTLAGGEKSLEYREPLSKKSNVTALSQSVTDLLWEKTNADYPNAETIEIHFPETDSSSILVSVNPDASTYWKTDFIYYDQYTLEEIKPTHIWQKTENATAADKLMRLNYDIHVGAIWGLAGKTLAFFASLICASLPVTGFLVWWGRKRKKQRKTQKP